MFQGSGFTAPPPPRGLPQNSGIFMRMAPSLLPSGWLSFPHETLGFRRSFAQGLLAALIEANGAVAGKSMFSTHTQQDLRKDVRKQHATKLL